MAFMKDFDYLKIQMNDVVSATNNFDSTKVIGSGGFGKVYRGELYTPEGQITVAFKQLDRRFGQGNIEFWKEVMMLSKYKHENLISLLHFCTEGDDMILVYEFASRGSLDRYLSDVNTLNWIQRLKICVGAARGIHFLHDPKETHQRVLHRDIKSANILLDENWMAKVSDFGLSKVGPANQGHSYLVTHGVGTPGYCDPLYMELGFLSKESDVYSFGVVLFEVLCGKLCYEYRNHELTRILVPNWRRSYLEKRLDEIILPGLKEQMDPASLKSFSAIAYQCIKRAREERPTMAKIVQQLEFSLEQQVIFENTPESNHSDGADDDYFQPPVLIDDDDSYDLEEELAKAVEDDHHPLYTTYVPREYQPMGYRVCGGCNRDIGHGKYLGCMGTFFHPECFRCHACRYPITEQEFSLSGKDAYHKTCFKELKHPKCEVCFQYIPTNGDGLSEYRCHPFWSQKYCPVHEHDNTARCCSCERLESVNARYISLGDGRSLCMECMESAIMDTGDCQPLYHSIREYYEGINMRLDQQIPMLLVERQALNEAIVREKHDGFHHMPETRGLCLSKEQTVASILKRPKIGGHMLIGMRTQPQKLTRRCEVIAILVLYGLPRLLTGAILANELMRGWLRLKGYRNLNPEVEEGICRVLSYMWLESEIMPASTSTSAPAPSSSSSVSKKGGISRVENKLGEFFMHRIAHDASPACGGGFRAANTAVNRYGLRRTLEHIRLTGSFPL